MSPTVLRDGPSRLFSSSREEQRMHVHVAHPDGEAKALLIVAAVACVAPMLRATTIDPALAVRAD